MKKFSNILVALGLTLFLLTVGIKSEARSCTSMKDTLIIDGCPYEVDLCVFCGLTYPGYVTVNNIRQLTNCASPLNSNQLLQQAFTQLANTASIIVNYCQTLIPPCSTQTTEVVKWRMYVCWKAILSYAPAPGLEQYHFVPCTDEYCEVEYSYCKDANGAVIKSFNNSTSYFDILGPTCKNTEGSDIVLPKYPLLIGSQSSCFVLHTPCNPDGFIWD